MAPMRSFSLTYATVLGLLPKNGLIINSRIVGNLQVVLAKLVIAEEQAVCSGRLKRKRDTFLPLLEHAIAYLPEFRVRFNVGLQIL